MKDKAPVTISSMLGSMMPRIPWDLARRLHPHQQLKNYITFIIIIIIIITVKKEKKTVAEDDDTVSTDSGFKESPEADGGKKSKTDKPVAIIEVGALTEMINEQ